MKKKVDIINLINVSFAILYAMATIFFALLFKKMGSQPYIDIYLILFFLLFLSSIALISFKEVGRKIFVALNLVLAVSLFSRYILVINKIDLIFMFLGIIAFVYFRQAGVKKFFVEMKKKQLWKSILIIDDDEGHVKMLRPILMSQGYSVLIALNGDDGLQIVKAQKPDLVLLDVILPGIKGRDVCKLIKENDETKDIPVVFLTAKDSPEDIQAEKDVGGEAHLTKPINTKELLETIKNILKKK